MLVCMRQNKLVCLTMTELAKVKHSSFSDTIVSEKIFVLTANILILSVIVTVKKNKLACLYLSQLTKGKRSSFADHIVNGEKSLVWTANNFFSDTDGEAK